MTALQLLACSSRFGVVLSSFARSGASRRDAPDLVPRVFGSAPTLGLTPAWRRRQLRNYRLNAAPDNKRLDLTRAGPGGP